MNDFSFIISPNDIGKRTDKFLSENISDISRSFIQNIIDSGNVLCNEKPIKPSYKLRENDFITVHIDDIKEVDILPVNIPIEILYEDEDILVVNKPKGMPVHPSNGHYDDTLVNSILYTHKDSLSGINGELRPGIVHRIDMNTTGSLIVCKNDETHRDIAKQIAAHSLTRKYVGIVHGRVKENEFTIDAPIARDPKNRQKNAVVLGGKEAITHVKVLETYKEFTYAEFVLETGRTHQIRVHMAHKGHPILGDDIYGPKKCPFKLDGQTLHAKTIGFIHPKTKEYIEVDAPLPAYFESLLNRFRNN